MDGLRLNRSFAALALCVFLMLEIGKLPTVAFGLGRTPIYDDPPTGPTATFTGQMTFNLHLFNPEESTYTQRVKKTIVSDANLIFHFTEDYTRLKITGWPQIETDNGYNVPLGHLAPTETIVVTFEQPHLGTFNPGTGEIRFNLAMHLDYTPDAILKVTDQDVMLAIYHFREPLVPELIRMRITEPEYNWWTGWFLGKYWHSITGVKIDGTIVPILPPDASPPIN